MRAVLPTDQTLLDRIAIVDVSDYPPAPQTLGNVSRHATAGKRITDEIPGVGGEFDYPFQDDRSQFVRRTSFVLLMPDRRHIIPNIREIQAFGIQVLLVTPIVFDIFVAMPALLHWRSYGISI